MLATSAAAFNVLKYAGAVYLLWMGIRILLAGNPARPSALAPAARPEAGRPRPLKAVFAGGFLTNVLNPKVAIFFLAFVPQFIAPETPDKTLTFVLLGVLFNLNSIPVNSGWALAAAWLARRGTIQRGMNWLDRAAAFMFIGFGLKLALTDHPSR